MIYKLMYAEKFLKQIRKLPKEIQQRIFVGLERCRIRPVSHLKKLVGSPYFRLRVGDYRVIIELKNNEFTILVLEVGHRKNIYKE